MTVVQSSVAFTQTKKMHCIEHIGFAHAIEASQAVEARRKIEGLRLITFKIAEFDLGEMHSAKVTMNDEL